MDHIQTKLLEILEIQKYFRACGTILERRDITIPCHGDYLKSYIKCKGKVGNHNPSLISILSSSNNYLNNHFLPITIWINRINGYGVSHIINNLDKQEKGVEFRGKILTRKGAFMTHINRYKDFISQTRA